MSGLPDQFIDEVRDRTVISDIVGRAVTWDQKKSKSRKGEYWAPCPFHHEKTASFKVDDKRGRFHCFGCKKSGDAFAFLTEREGLSFPEAVEKLAGEAGLQMPASSPEAERRAARRAKIRLCLTEAERWFQMKLRGQTGEAAVEYLKSRGIEGETAARFGIGYSPTEGGLMPYLRGLSFDEPTMIGAGVVGVSETGHNFERFKGRLIFPVHDHMGKIVGFGGRSLPGVDDVRAKYINSPASPLFDKSRILYNAHRARAAAGTACEVITVEGYFDVVALDQAGRPNAVAPMGTALSEQHLNQLWRMADEPVIMLDGDAAGQAAVKRTLSVALPVLKPGLSLRVGVLQAGADPADMMGDHVGRWRFANILDTATPLHRYLWQSAYDAADTTTPERTADFVRFLGDQVATIKDAQVKKLYSRAMKQLLWRELGIRSKMKNVYAGQGDAPPDETGALMSMSGPGIDLALSQDDLTDLGNARRFIQRNGHRFRFCTEIGWLAWDGKRWQIKGAEAIMKRAVDDTVMKIADEAEALAASKDDVVVKEYPRLQTFDMLSDSVHAWYLASQNVTRIKAIQTLAIPYLTVATSELDADPFKINVQNGTLVVRKSADEPYIQLKDHDPADLITKVAGVGYDRRARSPQYDAFLADVQESEDLRNYLHRWGGLSLTGDATEQKLHFWYGKGGNGKGVTINLWNYVAGDYCGTVGIETFLDQGRNRKGGDATPDLASLAGVRMLRTSEPEKNARLSEALIKLATGEEPMQVRHLHKDMFTLEVLFKLTIAGNYRPVITGTDEGIWRRMILVPWARNIPKQLRDKQLGNKLKSEGSGILNHLLDGLAAYLDEGLNEPQEVIDATQKYRIESDPLGQFLDNCTQEAVGDRVQSSELYEVFKAWCGQNDQREWTQTGFGRAMRDKGLTYKQSNVRYWLDIELTQTVADFKAVESDEADDRTPTAPKIGKGDEPPMPESEYDYD